MGCVYVLHHIIPLTEQNFGRAISESKVPLENILKRLAHIDGKYECLHVNKRPLEWYGFLHFRHLSIFQNLADLVASRKYTDRKRRARSHLYFHLYVNLLGPCSWSWVIPTYRTVMDSDGHVLAVLWPSCILWRRRKHAMYPTADSIIVPFLYNITFSEQKKLLNVKQLYIRAY